MTFDSPPGLNIAPINPPQTTTRHPASLRDDDLERTPIGARDIEDKLSSLHLRDSPSPTTSGSISHSRKQDAPSLFKVDSDGTSPISSPRHQGRQISAFGPRLDDQSRPGSIPTGSPLRLYRTLDEMLRTTPPAIPEIYRRGALSGTKTLNKTEKQLDPGIRLRKVVPLGRLVDQLDDTAEGLLDGLEFDWNNDLHHQVATLMLPASWSFLLPQVINSELDVGSWAGSTLFIPGILAGRMVENGNIGLHRDSRHPFMASAPHISVVADGVFTCMNDELGEHISMTLEHKSPNVFMHKGESIFEELFDVPNDAPDGLAVKFEWPGEHNKGDHLTRILAQVWTQLISNKCFLGILTSCSTTLFLARNKAYPDALFISPPYIRSACPVYACFCWFALASGLIDMDELNLPPPITDWWSDVTKNTSEKSVGIVPETYLKNFVRDS
ncbi:hypothetical protein A0H81_05250 [Grifola frondosa]|uniref:Uncharacterized protein n=1 Tax=Grifola frondosa TaxID=5627 RepID=A0A1C7MCW1_GRIFR|nr:hypothetical protein A0H81_05250 [Grifola frondosa]